MWSGVKPTIVRPLNYKNRFRKSMTQFFMPVHVKWFKIKFWKSWNLKNNALKIIKIVFNLILKISNIKAKNIKIL